VTPAFVVSYGPSTYGSAPRTRCWPFMVVEVRAPELSTGPSSVAQHLAGKELVGRNAPTRCRHWPAHPGCSPSIPSSAEDAGSALLGASNPCVRMPAASPARAAAAKSAGGVSRIWPATSASRIQTASASGISPPGAGGGGLLIDDRTGLKVHSCICVAGTPGIQDISWQVVDLLAEGGRFVGVRWRQSRALHCGVVGP